MTKPSQRSVLNKIAARRHGKGAAVPSTWTTFVTGRVSQAEVQTRLAVADGPQRLTRRELEVLHLVARGETDQGIADQLYVSRRTVNCHVSNILGKLDVKSRTAAVMKAAHIGLLSPRSGAKTDHAAKEQTMNLHQSPISAAVVARQRHQDLRSEA
jgi:DNA-binding NarL/FixJ family response regulator